MTITCPDCQRTVEVGEWPFCPHGVGQFNVQADSVPGGFVIENLGPKPQTFYSKSEYKQAMDIAGVKPMVRHVGEPGSDKSKFTQKWV